MGMMQMNRMLAEHGREQFPIYLQVPYALRRGTRQGLLAVAAESVLTNYILFPDKPLLSRCELIIGSREGNGHMDTV
jgi:hypothetical protein